MGWFELAKLFATVSFHLYENLPLPGPLVHCGG